MPFRANVRGARDMAAVDVPWSSRVRARLFADRYDHQVETGVTVGPGTPLAAHYARLRSVREREDMTQAVTRLLYDARRTSRAGGPMTRTPIRAEVVRASAGVVDEVLSRLADPLPVRARGMARLRILLSDGRGPLYRTGRGSVAAAIRGVLAAM
jgi:hypothetical protein